MCFAESSGLSEANQSAVRFMLLMSFAHFQIDEAIRDDLARHFPDEHERRAMGMWAGFQTAKLISKWAEESVMKFVKH